MRTNAERIIKMFGSYELSANNKVMQKRVRDVWPLASAINTIMKNEGFTIGEANYTWTVVQSVVDSVETFQCKQCKALSTC